ncbi:MAG: DUF805 domain-containing protein [Pseudomonadota bacterium]
MSLAVLGLMVFGEMLKMLPAFLVFIFGALVLWLAWVAIPVKRFHDMNRTGKWVALFWGIALASLYFLWMGFAANGRFVGMTVPEIFAMPQAYVDAVSALNQQHADQKPMKVINAISMGGVSLSMIFLIIQFGWLHFIPGTDGPNRFNVSAPPAIGE